MVQTHIPTPQVVVLSKKANISMDTVFKHVPRTSLQVNSVPNALHAKRKASTFFPFCFVLLIENLVSV